MADAKIRAWTDEEVRLIQKMIDRERRQVVNQSPNLVTDRWDQGEDHQAPETYVAAIPADGIPGKDDVDDYGDYPYSEYQEDLVGSAECDIYQIVKEGSFWKLREVTGLSKTVYNFGDQAIDGPGFVPITRDKFGKWLVLSSTGGGSNNQVIDFVVTDYCPDLPSGASLCVYATVTRVSCDASVSVGDEVLICDPDNCWFNLPIELLSGLVGTAVWMQNGGDVTLVCAEIPVVGSCFWKVNHLCCREEAYIYL